MLQLRWLFVFKPEFVENCEFGVQSWDDLQLSIFECISFGPGRFASRYLLYYLVDVPGVLSCDLCNDVILTGVVWSNGLTKKLKGVVYVSKALQRFNTKDLEGISDQACIANKDLEVTGYLYFENDYFVQYLEGEKSVVESLMGRIKDDPRHEVVNIFSKEEIEDRKFPSWNMKYVTKYMVSEIKLEFVLIDYILMVSNKLYKPRGDEEKIWSMVDKISYFRTRFN